MNRIELQELAEDRLLDAQALIDAGRCSGGYYLAGYAVECALKSCILHRVIRTGILFQEKQFAARCWTHDLDELVGLADLREARGLETAVNPQFGHHWSLVLVWTEVSRYTQTSQRDAELLYNAIADLPNGVLSWIKNHW